MDTHRIANGALAATVKADGAELCSLRDAAGREFLWPASPPWARHAPILFPIVGRLRDDTLRHRGQEHRLAQHGFARDRRFAWVAAEPTAARLMLEDDDTSRDAYPFAFRFEVSYALEDDRLATTFTLTNTGGGLLPASFGAHPAFVWPLLPGIAKEQHSIVFCDDETRPLRGVVGGLLTPAERPNPVRERRLALSPDLFASDALIFDQPASRAVRYTAPGAPRIEIAWDPGFPQLGIWSRTDADFLCIEPWHGMASPSDWDGEFADKPWLMHVPAGEQRRATFTIRIVPSDRD